MRSFYFYTSSSDVSVRASEIFEVDTINGGSQFIGCVFHGDNNDVIRDVSAVVAKTTGASRAHRHVLNNELVFDEGSMSDETLFVDGRIISDSVSLFELGASYNMVMGKTAFKLHIDYSPP